MAATAGVTTTSSRANRGGKLRFAAFGAGFWARYQLAAWKELPGAECVAIYNRTRHRAEALARELGIPAVYDDPAELLQRERPDFVDVITDPATHARFVELAAAHRTPVVCQKPLAPTLAAAEQLLQTCAAAGVRLIVHENWRWQTPIRKLKRVLSTGAIGRPYRCRMQFSFSFPVFDNQPFLKDLEQFIIADLGVHILDTARFLFGEAEEVYCQTARVHPEIRGEDVATLLLRLRGDQGPVTCSVELAYAGFRAREHFPETSILVEGERGSLEVQPGYRIELATPAAVRTRRYPPPRYAWADPAYLLVQSSIVACNADVLDALRTGRPAETEAADNIRTVRLVFAAYESAATGQAVRLGSPPRQ